MIEIMIFKNPKIYLFEVIYEAHSVPESLHL